ncbi:helix-turn-helix domain-containing protein [Geobacter sp. DSM 9736]|uniref:helix-turn-helix domain-containing protein n=1 Tax=Geobacter sp. DSM 9736 TaxID=1277350 RepID=UPI000B50742E|nr:XRE family transcriptional regulator [Geobacter sp. DSM 9736]SNB44716.1 transcriptional regulator, XRE family with cupin sensor [Geobacter sp. DSM 9736]
MKIGERLKRFRMINSLTQEELASRADLTKGYISQLENDTTSPSIATLKDILDVFGVSMQEFFSEVRDEEIVFGADSRVQSSDDDDGVRVELLVPGAQNREMDPALVTIAPGEEMEEQPFHEGEEFGYVLLGKIQLKLDDKVYTVKKDECFYFTSDKRHTIKNIGKGMAKILWVVTPPTFDY